MSFLNENRTIEYFLFHPHHLGHFYLTIFWLKIKTFLGLDPNFQDDSFSEIPIDIVMPTLDRDFEVVTEVVDSLRKNIKHPIAQIIIISPPSKRIQSMCKQKKCTWVDENTVLPITIKDIHVTVNGLNRSGWIYQQLLKWEAAKYVLSDHFLVTESDTIYCRPHVFLKDGKTILSCSSAIPHIPYFDAYRKLFNEVAPATKYLTSHHLLFSKKYLKQAKKQIERNCQMPWYQAIISKLDPNQISSVSDYESYGQYVIKHHPKKFIFEHWENKSFPRSALKELNSLTQKYASTTKTLSFHSYNE